MIRVLVVEDDMLQAGLLCALLEQAGFFVETADCGVEALQKVRTGWFDLVLMDYALPEMDGLAAARLIATPSIASCRPRLVGLTASPDRLGAHAASGECVFDAVLAKPWHPDRLIETLRRCHAESPMPRLAWADQHGLLDNRHGMARGIASLSIPPPPDDAMRILVADDDGLWRSVLKDALEALGHDVVTAPDGLQALMNMAAHAYDIVIADYQMPELDGIAAARLIFDRMAVQTRPRLIALTASPDLLKRLLAGQPDLFDEVVPKRHGLPGLLAAVERCAHYARHSRRAVPVRVMDLAIDL